MADDDFDIRPGRSRDSGARFYRKANTLVGKVLQASRRAGYAPLRRGNSGKGTGHLGRGKRAALQRRRSASQRRVIIKARVVRHRGASFRSAPLARHAAYLERDGVTRDGAKGRLFDATSDQVDGDTFAARCEDDRHHFRFIVSPEDASEMADLRAFTRELMDDAARDLDTTLDWVAVDHWNTDNPHIHVLVRGVASDGKDLVIDRSYISEGMRGRAEERVTIELGPRSEREIDNALRREVDAERWTDLDRRLQRMSDDLGSIDLLPEADGAARRDRTLLIGRAQKLERMGLAQQVGPASWTLSAGIEPTLRELGDRGDIIKTMHRAMRGQGTMVDPSRFALHTDLPGEPVIGRLVERGLHDELSGSAYAIVDGLDGQTHHLRFPDLDRTGDASLGAIVELSAWTDRKGREQASLLVRSDVAIESQIHSRGATWLDRQLVSPKPQALTDGFGSEVRVALAERSDVLSEQGLAKRQGQRIVFASNLLDTLRERELAEAGEALAKRHGLMSQPVNEGEHIVGTYRERVTLASGRFAMIDNGSGFQLVPWRQDLERHLGQVVSGRMNERGGIDWSFARSRGPAI
ncbi:DUF3363 domain-containing protein [Porphyrobacter algicida]|uniref:DUF3363 domain-containing protein n=1 Tax=Qipengyuania algicida TaxID=1836209 RepID=A0A845ANU7_9SPHN|nr:VirD2 family relaxase/mobilization nuclease [Qipengyuania algicida]MXP30176.1 DUF3363 domain-containing protein [Qipengyuania algicida]